MKEIRTLTFREYKIYIQTIDSTNKCDNFCANIKKASNHNRFLVSQDCSYNRFIVLFESTKLPGMLSLIAKIVKPSTYMARMSYES